MRNMHAGTRLATEGIEEGGDIFVASVNMYFTSRPDGLSFGRCLDNGERLRLHETPALDGASKCSVE